MLVSLFYSSSFCLCPISSAGGLTHFAKLTSVTVERGSECKRVSNDKALNYTDHKSVELGFVVSVCGSLLRSVCECKCMCVCVLGENSLPSFRDLLAH